ncbi:MAG: S-layer homology domain-containing protein [Clostridiaceae bacterium]|nr:S-layer homology domain-containing protein [Clostridiaceae bacterium]
MVYKRLSLLMVLVLVLSSLGMISYARTEFPDLPSQHWAYSAVMDLVDDGTVNGFEDGEFKPDKTVSRAEFVKMIGKSAIKRDSDFSDISQSHWGYDYIMYSQLEGSGNVFDPDSAITRDTCLNLIWKRNGSQSSYVAPSIITNQSSDKEAAAWGYASGLMIGDDGLNLRLADSLTRAEAAILIVRARQNAQNTEKTSFAGTVSEQLLEVVFNSMDIFNGVTYDAGKSVTNGEMARAALLLSFESPNIKYKALPDTLFVHDYAKDYYTVFSECIDEGKISEQHIDAPATIEDTLTALVYYSIKRSNSIVKYGSTGNFYTDVDKPGSQMADICLTYAFENGIRLFADNTIGADKPITHKEIACLILQLDNLIGLKTEYTTENKAGRPINNNSKIRNNLFDYPSNSSDYAYILDGLPNEVYQTPFAQSIGNLPKTVYDFAKEYNVIFTNMLAEISKKIQEQSGAVIQFTFYTSLICNNGNGATLRVKCEIHNNENKALLSQIFSNDGFEQIAPEAGTVLFLDIITGQQLTDVYLATNTVSVEQIVYKQ